MAPKIARSLGDGWRREHNKNPDVTHCIATFGTRGSRTWGR